MSDAARVRVPGRAYGFLCETGVRRHLVFVTDVDVSYQVALYSQGLSVRAVDRVLLRLRVILWSLSFSDLANRGVNLREPSRGRRLPSSDTMF